MTPATATPPTSIREIDDASLIHPARASVCGARDLSLRRSSRPSIRSRICTTIGTAMERVAPTRLALMSAAWIVAQLAATGPIPQIFPTRRGGAQLEWHTPHTRLEWEIDPDGVSGVFIFDNDITGVKVDGDLPADQVGLRLALAQVIADR